MFSARLAPDGPVVFEAPAALPGSAAEWIGAVLFLTVSLAIAGITSALRAARIANLSMREEVVARDAEHDEQEALMREIADDVPAMLWWSRADGRCIHVNAAWRTFTGRTLDEAVGDGWLADVHPDDVARWRGALVRALKGRWPGLEFHVAFTRARIGAFGLKPCVMTGKGGLLIEVRVVNGGLRLPEKK